MRIYIGKGENSLYLISLLNNALHTTEAEKFCSEKKTRDILKKILTINHFDV